MPRFYRSTSDDATHDAQTDDADAFGVLFYKKAIRLHSSAKSLKSDFYPSHTNAMLDVPLLAAA